MLGSFHSPVRSTMKIVLAPNAFKGSLSAMAAAVVMEQGVRAAFPAAGDRAAWVSNPVATIN